MNFRVEIEGLVLDRGMEGLFCNRREDRVNLFRCWWVGDMVVGGSLRKLL